MYVLHRKSSAYGTASPILISAETEAEACKKIIDCREKEGENFEYFLFDINNIDVLPNENEEGIVISFSGISGLRQSVPLAFEQYFTEHGLTFSEWKCYMTYQQIADHISDLKQFLVDKKLTDDPFQSFEWQLNTQEGNVVTFEEETWQVSELDSI